jgi:hypothetical protein
MKSRTNDSFNESNQRQTAGTTERIKINDKINAELTLELEGLGFLLTLSVKEWPVRSTCVRAWCRSDERQPPLKHVRQTSTPRGWSW